MTISIRTAISNVFSDKYDKVNVLYFCIILLITVIASFISLNNLNSNDIITLMSTIACYSLISFIASIFLMGIYILAANRGYKGQNSIFPNFFDDFKSIIITGIQFYGGFLIMYIACFFISILFALIFIPFIIFGSSKSLITILILSVFFILFLILILFLIVTMCGLIFNFTKSLKFEDFLNVKKALYLINSAKKEFLIYILKLLVFTIPLCLLFFGLFILTTLVLSFAGETSQIQITVIFGIFMGICNIFITLFQLDLLIQFLTETKKYELPKEEEPQEEYLEDYYDYPEN